MTRALLAFALLCTQAIAQTVMPPGEWVDVRRFGVVPNSASDQQTAIQAALDSGHPIWFPPGTYTSSPLAIPARGAIRGAGMYLTVIKLADNSIPADNPFTNHSVLQNENITSIEYGGGAEPQDHDIYVGHLTLDGNSANQTSTYTEAECLNFYGVRNAWVEHVRCINSVADGIDIDYCDNIQFRNVQADNAGKTGIHFSIGSPQSINRGNNNCSVVGALITNCTNAGLTDFLTGAGGNDNSFEDIVVVNCKNETPTFNGAVSIISQSAFLRNVRVVDTNTTSTSAGRMEAILLGGNDIEAIGLSVENVDGTVSDGRGVIVEGDRCVVQIDRVTATNNNAVRLSGCNDCNVMLAGITGAGSHGVSIRDAAANNFVTGTIAQATSNGLQLSGAAVNNVIHGLRVLEVGTTAGNNHGVQLVATADNNVVSSCDFGALPTGQGVDDQATGTRLANNVNQ